MSGPVRHRRAPIALCVLTVLLAVPAGASAVGAGDLERQLGPGAEVAAEAETGRQVTFVGTRSGRSIPLARRAPGRAAREAVERLGPAFGQRAGAKLAVEEIDRHDGRATVRFQQQIGGLPVIGGELVVNLDENDDLLSVGGELEPAGEVATSASVGEGDAAATARAAVAKKYGLFPDELLSGPGELSVYDSRLLGGPGLGVPRPVWRFEVVDRGDPVSVRELVLVDAGLGNVALSFSEIHAAKTRRVCDAENLEAKLPCLAGQAARKEGEGPVSGAGEIDVNAAYDQSGGVYDFYLSRFGRDGIDGAGLPLISTVRYCESDEPCPLPNAFWNGEQMTYGAGNVTEDIAGHELAHGVTESDSGLFYYYQSGAINESLSDVFGELYDLATGSDPPGDRWLIGEGSAIGVIRNMADPTPEPFEDPDRTGSDKWRFNPETSFETGDAGGVHTNSGVNNKAAYLLTDGDTFNGEEIEGLGEEKVAQIYYEVSANLLSSASDYEDLGRALRQACANLIGEHGIIEEDCEEVEKAVLATEMDKPVAIGAPKVAPTCGEGGIGEPVFFDDLENTGSGNWAKSAVLNESGEAGFRYPQPIGFTYATSGTTNVWGYDAEGISDSRIAMTKDVKVPASGRMHFNHAYGFESSEGTSWDGGVLEYSTGGGAAGTWKDAGGLIDAGLAYSGTISDEAGNPLENRQAFSGESGGYGSTRLDLSSLAGEEVRFRFRLGTDEAVDDYGWFIDDVQIYRCEGAEPEDELPEEEPEEPSSEGSPEGGFSTNNLASSQTSPTSPSSAAQLELSPDCTPRRTRLRRARRALGRAARRARKGRTAVRKAGGGKHRASARRQLRRARKSAKRKRRAVRRARARLRACLG